MTARRIRRPRAEGSRTRRRRPTFAKFARQGYPAAKGVGEEMTRTATLVPLYIAVAIVGLILGAAVAAAS